MSLLECTGRWAAYCISLTIAPVIALAWYVHPSTETAVLIASASSLGLAYALGAREGLLWSPFLALWAILYLTSTDTSGAAVIAVAGALAILALSRRPLSLTLAVIAAPLLGGGPYLCLVISVAAFLGPILESRTLHSVSLIVVAPLLVVLGSEWSLLLAASVLVASAYLEGSLTTEKCPFRRESGLLAAGIAVIALSLLAKALAPTLDGEWLTGVAEALWVMGYTLEDSALLVPRGLGVLLRKAKAEPSTIPSEALIHEASEA